MHPQLGVRSIAADHQSNSWEETIYYPLFNPKFDTASIVAEHATFTKGMHDFEEYLVSCLPEGEKWGYGQVAGPHEQRPYDGQKLRDLVDAFVDPLTKHVSHACVITERRLMLL